MLTLFPAMFAVLFYSVINTMEIGQHSDSKIGYQCGHKIFTNQKIQEALEASTFHLEIESTYPAPFKGPLYDDNLDLFIWPIKTHGKVFRPRSDSAGPHFIVINKNKEFVEVIVRLWDQNFAKCSKYDPSRPGISEPVIEDSNGYQCGHVFLSDKNIHDAQYSAMNRLGKDSTVYPKFIMDPMYERELKYQIWPVRKPSRLNVNELEDVGPFYIVYDSIGNLVDVVAQLSDKKFVKCLRDRKVEAASPHDPLSKLFVPPPASGFHCGRIFFKEEYLKQAASVAAEVTRSKRKDRSRKKTLLVKFGKEPFDQGTFLWPLLPKHKLLLTGNAGLYRVVLSSDFEVAGAIIIKEDLFYQCPKGTLKNKKNHDMNDYDCLFVDFSHIKLLNVAEKACKRLNIPGIRFPAIYEGPEFEIDGPYLTYPILESGHFTHASVRFRLVTNSNCEVVGALFKQDKRFYKCRKKVNGASKEFVPDKTEPIIKEIFFESLIIVFAFIYQKIVYLVSKYASLKIDGRGGREKQNSVNRINLYRDNRTNKL